MSKTDEYVLEVLDFIRRNKDEKIYIGTASIKTALTLHKVLSELTTAKCGVMRIDMDRSQREELFFGPTQYVLAVNGLIMTGWRSATRGACICSTHAVNNAQAIQLSGRVARDAPMYLPFRNDDGTTNAYLSFNKLLHEERREYERN